MVIRKDCSGCMEPFTLVIRRDGSDRPDAEAFVSATVKMVVPSNGKRGSLHVPQHEVTTEAVLNTDGVLLYWDCPRCGYAESEYVDDETRRALT